MEEKQKFNEQNDKGDNKVPAFNLSYIFLALLAVMLINRYLFERGQLETIPYSAFLQRVEGGQVKEVTITNFKITGTFDDATKDRPQLFQTIPVNDPELVNKLKSKGVVFKGDIPNPLWESLFSWVFPLAIFYFVWMFLAKKVSQGTQGMLSMTKSKAKVYLEKDVKVKFDDVAGVDEAKEELKEIVNFLRDPKSYTRLGGHAPKGALLIGPPGTGKTLLARALAGESEVPFFSINGSEFVEMFVGLGAARVRDLFKDARKNAPCILFIDEIDALGKTRAGGFGSGSNDEKEQTLNQLLAEMDGFDTSKGVMILGATNRPEVLDPALLRAGRFDRQILVNNPDQHGRLQILRVHIKKIKIHTGLNLDRIASLTAGFSGADLANLVNEAALVATRRNADAVFEEDFTQAAERIVAGLEQKKKFMNPEEKRRIAFHEMGHATVALGLDSLDKVHKVSVIPRGIGALGYTLQRPTEDRYIIDMLELKKKVSVLLGGRASEEIFFDHVSTGASDDLVKATNITMAMVIQYGMSDKIGLASYERNQSPFLQNGINIRGPYSDQTALEVDLEVKRILDDCMLLAKKTLYENRSFVEKGVKQLLLEETLEEDMIKDLWEKDGHHVTIDSDVVILGRQKIDDLGSDTP